MNLPSKVVRFRYLLMLLVGLMLADALITQFLVESGIGREGNPFLRGLLATGGFMPIKIAGGLLSAIILADINRRYPKIASVTLLFFIALYTAIVYWNVSILGVSFKF